MTTAEIRNNCEVVKHTTATQLAEAFERHSGRVMDLRAKMLQEVQRLNEVFNANNLDAKFTVEIGVCEAAEEDQILREMKRTAWRSLIDKLGIRQFMSMKRKEEFDSAIRTPGRQGHCRWINKQPQDGIDNIPEITAESIMGVLTGEMASAGEYLRENVVEVYKALKPSWRCELKTNVKNRWMLSDKVILDFGCSHMTGDKWTLGYSKGHLVENLENVFRLLDGKGFRNTSMSEIAESMRERGVGETAYFGYKCFKNQRLHLKFLRSDLLQQFNQLAGNSWQLRGRDEDEYQAGDGPDFSHDDPYRGGPDLFETPEELAVEMCRVAGIGVGSRVLEPSCGPGRIVTAAISFGACVTALDLHDGLDYQLRQNPAVIATDQENFLALKPDSIGGFFNAVLMNPPFSLGRDVKHVRHAWRFVARGGCLVAVMSRGVVFRQDKLYREFREWLQERNGQIVDLPSRSFRGSGTDVETVMVVIRDPSSEMVVGEEQWVKSC